MDRRDPPRQEQVRKIAQEHSMARFQFDQQPETGRGPRALNALVGDLIHAQYPGGFVHEYTLEGEEN
jgi:hypothetical protein